MGTQQGEKEGWTGDAHNDRRAIRLGLDRRLEKRLGSTGEGVELEDTRGSVPEDRLGLEDGRGEGLARLRSAVETHPAGGDAGLVRGGANLSCEE